MKQQRIAGVTLVLTSLGFVAVFSYLAASFGYPEVLDGSAAKVLPAFIAGGVKLRWVWAAYAALPIGVALAAILAYPVLRPSGETSARFGLVAAIVASVAMSAGLLRWPTFHYRLGQRFVQAGVEEQRLIAALFDAANLYLGNVVGEFIGEVAMSTWFATLGLAILRGTGLPRWVGYLGLFTAASLGVGALRNVTGWVAPIAALNNNLLPLWLITLGATMLRGSQSSSRRDGTIGLTN
jgi:hypothetical protein